MNRFLASILLAAALSACGASEARDPQAGQAPAQTAAVCPPCRMAVQPHYERIEVDGLRFAICNPRCGEILRRDARRFAADALP